eukprot:77918-Hanusia_phi.AAC.2
MGSMHGNGVGNSMMKQPMGLNVPMTTNSTNTHFNNNMVPPPPSRKPLPLTNIPPPPPRPRGMKGQVDKNALAMGMSGNSMGDMGGKMEMQREFASRNHPYNR